MKILTSAFSLASLCVNLLFAGQAFAEAPVIYPSKKYPDFPFSEAVAYNGVLYLSGDLGADSTGKLVSGGIEAETRQTMENIKATLGRHGLEMGDIIKCTVFLADIAEWPGFNKIYKTYFEKGRYPARSALAASGLALGARVELECMAALHSREDECPASGEYSYVCGPQSAEDLVLVPGTEFIIASGFGSGASMYLIDAQQKTWAEFYPTETPLARQDMDSYAACPGAPDPDNFVTHGLNLRPGEKGHSTLYVVGHGAREAIEVFDVNASDAKPVLTWRGCVMLPEGLVANSVASLSDGSLLATVPLHPGKSMIEAMAGVSTGAVYRWSPGGEGFQLVEGTELPYGNGIEVSADGQEFYVASSGLFTVTAYSNTDPARQLRVTDPMAFIPDNLHMGRDGQLITAGLVADHPPCGVIGDGEDFKLEEFAACPRPFIVKAVDPKTMEAKDIARGPANKNFSNITMALPVGDELWIGTFAGDRVAYRSLKPHD